MARSPAKEMPASDVATRGADRKKAVAEAAARTPARKKAAAPEPAMPSLTQAAPAPVAATPKGRLYMVTRSQSAAWKSGLPLEEQGGWAEHAQFMNDLEASGFVVAGGPLDGTPYTVLAVRADNEAEAQTRLRADPWEESRVLETTRIVGWDLRLGAGKL
jgi:uncharacterized protein YciI